MNIPVIEIRCIDSDHFLLGCAQVLVGEQGAVAARMEPKEVTITSDHDSLAKVKKIGINSMLWATWDGRRALLLDEVMPINPERLSIRTYFNLGSDHPVETLKDALDMCFMDIVGDLDDASDFAFNAARLLADKLDVMEI